MMFFIYLLFQINIQNQFSNDIQWYQIPDYTKKNYKDIVHFRLSDSLYTQTPYFSLETHLLIDQPIGYDSLEDDSYGFKKNNIQLYQFELKTKYKFIKLSLGRILNWEQKPYIPLNGIKITFFYKKLSFNLLKGENITESNFLGLTNFFDQNSLKKVLYQNISIMYDSKNIKSMIGILKKEDNNSDRLSNNLYWDFEVNYKKLKFLMDSDYNYGLEKLENFSIITQYRHYGFKWEYYQPIFDYDSIFNIFLPNNYNQMGIFIKYKFINITLYEINSFDNFGISTKFNTKNFIFFAEYFYQDYLKGRIVSNLNPSISFETFYNLDDNFYSEALNINYLYNFYSLSDIVFSISSIYSSFYKLQFRIFLSLSLRI